MRVDLEVPITVPPLHLFRVKEGKREEITYRSFKGFGDVTHTTVKFRVGDGDYVVVDDQKKETAISVVNGQVVETPQLAVEPEMEPTAEAKEEEAPMTFRAQVDKIGEL
jgi:hypothetical protein